MTDWFDRVRIDSRAFKQDPHPFYDWMRAEAPVGRVRLPIVRQAWVVARYGDVAAFLKDPRLVKDRSNAGLGVPAMGLPLLGEILAPLMNSMLEKDDPDHARLRRLAQVAFTPRQVERMTSRVEAVCEALLDRLKGRAEMDLMADYALPLPVIVIAELLGVPEAERMRFVRGSRVLFSLGRSRLAALVGIAPLLAFVKYVRELIARRRAAPGDDLISALLAARESGALLSDDELVAMIVLLLTAGHETTTNLIGNGVVSLLEHPREADRLRAEPRLIDTAIEELLRFASPAETSTFRYAREDMEIAGVHVRRGEVVLGLIASANRDSSVFPDSHRLDLARLPNRHLSFGMGGHYCLGAPLARVEGRIAIAALLGRFPRLRLAQRRDELAWRPGFVLRGLERARLAIA